MPCAWPTRRHAVHLRADLTHVLGARTHRGRGDRDLTRAARVSFGPVTSWLAAVTQEEASLAELSQSPAGQVLERALLPVIRPQKSESRLGRYPGPLPALRTQDSTE